MSKDKTPLAGTVDIDEVKQIANKVFNNPANGSTLPTGEVRPVSKGNEPAKFRPNIEMPEEDYIKLRHICTNVHEDMGKMLYQVVKTWLDSCEVKI